MFGRTTDRDDVVATRTAGARPFRARGGVSGGAVLTGTVVAFGAFAIFSVIIGAVLVGLGLQEGDISQQEAIDAGIWTGVGLVVAQFLAYLWGGYTAGRMARGSGFANGLLVPIVALLITGLIVAIAGGIGYTTEPTINLPFSTDALPWNNDNLQDWTVGLGIAFVVAMFLGAIFGGLAGARWHTKLEDRVYDEEVVAEGRTVDVTDSDDTRAYPATTGAGYSRTGSRVTDGDAPPPPPASTTEGTYGERTDSGTTRTVK